jgi:hypothetical protein
MRDRKVLDTRDIGAKQSFVASAGHDAREFKCVCPATQAIQMWISQPMPFDRRTRGDRESVSYGDETQSASGALKSKARFSSARTERGTPSEFE